LTDPRAEVLDSLLQLTQDCLRALRNGTSDLAPYDTQRDALLGRLQALDEAQGEPSAPVRERLERLRALNEALVAEVRGVMKETEERLKGVAKGRRGMSGYRDSAKGPSSGAKLGRG
jgi:hypothetical protein